MFDFKKAQEYELEWQKGYIKDVLPPLYNDYVNGNDTPSLQTWLPEEYREAFLSHLKDKRGLEIGCGSIPYLRHSYGLKSRFAIDPLIQEYKRIQEEEFGGSFFEGVELADSPAEDVSIAPDGLIDGVVICRNAIDHAEDPLKILVNISDYAAKGCYFLFWTDIWHILPPDAGHRNITRSAEVIEALLKGLGFKRLHYIEPQHDREEHIEYGGVFIKE